MNEKSFQILGISHVGLAPQSASQLASFFSDTLGLTEVGSETVLTQKTSTLVFCSTYADPNPKASGRLEVLAPTDDSSPIAAFLAKRGSGIHHIALQVDRIDALCAYLKTKNIPTTTEVPVPGIHGSRVLFVHPKATSGILVEFVEESF